MLGEAMLDVFMNKAISIGITFAAIILYQASEMMNGLISQAVEQSLAVAMLFAVVYLLWKDNKAVREYNEKRDERIENLVSENTRALFDAADSLDDVRNVLERIQNQFERDEKV